MVDMMKVDSLEMLNNLTVDESKPKRKCKGYGLLTPILVKVVEETDLKITNVFLKLVDAIKSTMTPWAEGEVAETEDEILTRISEPYDHILYFLWASHKFPEEVHSPLMAVIQDESPLKWERETRDVCLGTTKPTKVIDLTYGEPKSSVPDGAIAAITNLSRSMIKHQKATLKKQGEKDDSRLKS